MFSVWMGRIRPNFSSTRSHRRTGSNPATKVYTLHSHAMGNVGDFMLTLSPDGYTWDIPAGPITIHYTAVIKDGAWREVGDRIVPGKDPVRFFEMNLKRVGETDWPAAGAISPK